LGPLRFALAAGLFLVVSAQNSRAEVELGRSDIVFIEIAGSSARIGARFDGRLFAIPSDKTDGFCYTAFYGPGLTECLKTCDGSRVFQLGQEADFASAWRTTEAIRMGSGSLPHVFSGGGSKLLRLKSQNTAFLRFNPPEAGSPTCALGPEGDTCLEKVGTELLVEEFIALYSEALLARATQMAPAKQDLRTEFMALAELSRELEQLLNSAKLAEFGRGGFFYAQNFRNAPALLCGAADASGASGSPLTRALQANREELEKSIEFLRRLSSSPVSH